VNDKEENEYEDGINEKGKLKRGNKNEKKERERLV